MKLEEQFQYLVGGYFGVELLDEYDLKIYLLKDIEKYIIDFLNANPIKDFDYINEAKKIKDALLILNLMDVQMQVIFLIKKRLKKMNAKVNI